MAQQYTKCLIRDAFIAMLNEKPLKKITVKDIAIACQINRNAFYYHYNDVYQLLEEIFDDELNAVIQTYNDTLSWEESFILAATFALENKTAIYHVYDSMQRDSLLNYIYRVSGNVMQQYVHDANADIGADESDVNLIASFYKSALTTLVIRWIETGMKEDPHEVVGRIGYLFDGNIQNSLERSIN
ncbi:TetR/AcrR family transcriptional regulator [Erysipelothrix anatis]|uniref:TetR/AcrR family transcriptional regulator n=1 Tax=Erysipelothrix anatis TaxID=2683713 RepID=UPI00135BA855|nr:TetR/AcrR family transcriptional regulator [Erysipelothrix anatis]